MIMVIFQDAFVSGRENYLPDPAYDAFVSEENLASSPDTAYDAKK